MCVMFLNYTDLMKCNYYENWLNKTHQIIIEGKNTCPYEQKIIIISQKN